MPRCGTALDSREAVCNTVHSAAQTDCIRRPSCHQKAKSRKRRKGPPPRSRQPAFEPLGRGRQAQGRGPRSTKFPTEKKKKKSEELQANLWTLTEGPRSGLTLTGGRYVPAYPPRLPLAPHIGQVPKLPWFLSRADAVPRYHCTLVLTTQNS